jgi:hypothetical protein
MGLLTGADPMASWWLAIVLLVVVTAVVAVLLQQIIGAASAIEGAVATVWANGQRVANNTIHIANLYRTSEATEAILGRVGRIAASASTIKSHAETCDGCPQCIWHK